MKVQEGLPYEQGGNASRIFNGVPLRMLSLRRFTAGAFAVPFRDLN